MNRVTFSVFILMVLASLPSVNAVPCTSFPVDGCEVTGDLTFDPGAYFLPNGISITASDVTLDCNGAHLTGGTQEKSAIMFQEVDNIVIKNCVITDYLFGFSVALSAHSTTNAIFEHNFLDDNHFGMSINGTGSESIIIRDNYFGVFTEDALRLDANHSLIINNTFISSGNWIISLAGANNTVENNSIIASNGGLLIGFETLFGDGTSTFNTTLKNNVIGNLFVQQRGINSTWQGNRIIEVNMQVIDVSEHALYVDNIFDLSDVNNDGLHTRFCHEGVSNDWPDGALRTRQSMDLDPACVYDWPFGLLIEESDVTLDCKGATIKGLSSGDTGIRTATELSGVNIQDCVLEDFTVGVSFDGSDYNVEGLVVDADSSSLALSFSEILDSSFSGPGLTTTVSGSHSLYADNNFQDGVVLENAFNIDFDDNTFGPYSYVVDESAEEISMVGNTFDGTQVQDLADDSIWCVNDVGNTYVHPATYDGPDHAGGTCFPLHCSNGVKDVDEEAIDCGPSCERCGDLEVISVAFLQTVEDVPLIQDKMGVARAVVRWNSMKIDDDVNAKVQFSITNGELDSLDSPPVQMISPNTNVIFDIDVSPTILGSERMFEAFASTPDFTDADETNNLGFKEVDVVATSPFKLSYVPIEQSNVDVFEGFAEGHHQFLEAIYPLSESNAKAEFVPVPYSLNLLERLLTSFPGEAGVNIRILGYNQVSKSIDKHAKRYGKQHPHKTMGLFPQGIFDEPGYGGYNFPGAIGQENLRMATAHELGGTWGLCDEYDVDSWEDQNDEFSCPNGRFDSTLDPSCLPRGCPTETIERLHPFIASASDQFVDFENVMGKGDVDEHWIDGPTYEFLITQLSSPTVVNISSRLLVAGTIVRNDSNYSVQLDHLEKLESGEIFSDLGEKGNFTLVFLDSNENITFSFNFTPSFLGRILNGSTIELNESVFVFVVERPLDFETLKVLDNSTGFTIGEIGATPHIPEVEIITPIPEKSFSQFVEISWNATDGDDDFLLFSIGISNDGGETWHTMVSDLENSSFTFDHNNSLLASSSDYLIRVRATDGFHSSEDTTNGTFLINETCFDIDGDSVCDESDNCIAYMNPIQEDSDADGVGDACDQCGATVLPESVPTQKLNPNHFAEVDGDSIFEEGKNEEDSSYSIITTRGCSCQQILEIKPGNNNGEIKHGCTTATMQIFIYQGGWE